MVPGKRTGENTAKLVADFAERTGGTPPALVTSDEYAPYATALATQYGQLITPPRTGKPGRPAHPYNVPSPDLVYATVHKTREKGRVVEVTRKLVYGNTYQLEAALAASTVSKTVNTSFIERYNGTDRHFNARKVRDTYAFSKDRVVHEAASWIGITVYNFCRPQRALAPRGPERERSQWRTPAVIAGLAPTTLTLFDIVQAPLSIPKNRSIWCSTPGWIPGPSRFRAQPDAAATNAAGAPVATSLPSPSRCWVKAPATGTAWVGTTWATTSLRLPTSIQ